MDDAAEPTIFTRILRGEIPGHFVWRDDEVAAFMTIAPLTAGHTLVITVDQIDHWLDVPAATWNHLNDVARWIGEAQMSVFSPQRIGTIVAGLEVPHCHLHVVPIRTEADLSFGRADPSVTAETLAAHAHSLREALATAGHTSDL